MMINHAAVSSAGTGLPVQMCEVFFRTIFPPTCWVISIAVESWLNTHITRSVPAGLTLEPGISDFLQQYTSVIPAIGEGWHALIQLAQSDHGLSRFTN